MLCGSSFCGCAIVSVPASSGSIGGALPTIDVNGNGTSASPWNLTLNTQWAGKLAGQSERMAVHLSNTVSRSIAHNIETIISWNAETFDAGGLHLAGNSRITVPVGGAGLWAVGHRLRWVASAVGFRVSFIRKNDLAFTYIGYDTTPAASAVSVEINTSSSTIVRLVDGDFLAVRALQTSGASLDIQGDNTGPILSDFWAYRLGD